MPASAEQTVGLVLSDLLGGTMGFAVFREMPLANYRIPRGADVDCRAAALEALDPVATIL